MVATKVHPKQLKQDGAAAYDSLAWNGTAWVPRTVRSQGKFRDIPDVVDAGFGATYFATDVGCTYFCDGKCWTPTEGQDAFQSNWDVLGVVVGASSLGTCFALDDLVIAGPDAGSSGLSARSTDGGASWSAPTVTIPGYSFYNLYSIATDFAGVFVAGGFLIDGSFNYTRAVFRSTDAGATWSIAQTLGALAGTESSWMVYDRVNGVFIFSTTNKLYTSPTGVTWTERIDFTSSSLLSAPRITTARGITIIRGTSSTLGFLWRSTNGTTYSTLSGWGTTATDMIYGVYYALGEFFMHTYNTTNVLHSPDGLSPSTTVIPSPANATLLPFGGGLITRALASTLRYGVYRSFALEGDWTIPPQPADGNTSASGSLDAAVHYVVTPFHVFRTRRGVMPARSVVALAPSDLTLTDGSYPTIGGGRILRPSYSVLGSTRSLQPGLAESGYSCWMPPITGTATAVIGRAATTEPRVPTLVTPTAGSEARLALWRLRYNTGTGIGNVTGLRATTAYLGSPVDVCGGSGFLFRCRVGFPDVSRSGGQLFIGVGPASALAGNPSALTNAVGVGHDSNQYSFMNIFASGSVAQTPRTPGPPFGEDIIVEIQCGTRARTSSNSAERYVLINIYNVEYSTITSIRNRRKQVASFFTVASAEIPAAGTLIAPQIQLRNTTATDLRFDLVWAEMETLNC